MPSPISSTLSTLGRILYALSLLGFGLQYAIYGQLRRSLPLCPADLPHHHLLAYALAAAFIGAGVVLLTSWLTLPVSLFLSLLLLALSALYLWPLQGNLNDTLGYTFSNGNARTVFLQCLSFAATALILHGLLAGTKGRYTLMPGRILFAFAMVLFGLQHFLYVRFLATLVPRWIHGHHSWVILTGFALIVAGMSIATTIEDKFASYGLFLLFAGWLALLHAPRIFHHPRSGNEWSSGLVVLGLSGASLLLAAASGGKPKPVKRERPWRP
ncbi:MAG: hypothetical protein ACP5E5_10260 [Acidobacteriaceae bacterium]